MSEGVNKVLLLGNLGGPPELRVTRGGQAVLNLRVATTESYLDKDKVRRERTDWHNVVVWGKRAEGLAKFLVQGHRVFVEGSLVTSSYEDRDGNKRYKTEVNARNVIPERAPKSSEGPREDGDRAEASGQRRGYGAPPGRREPLPKQPNDFGDGEPDFGAHFDGDDIQPF